MTFCMTDSSFVPSDWTVIVLLRGSIASHHCFYHFHVNHYSDSALTLKLCSEAM